MNKLILSVLALALFALPVQAENTAAGLPKIPGVEGPAFNFVDGKIMISLKLLLIEIDAGGSMVIPKTKSSRFELSPNLIDGGTLAQIILDPADIKGVIVANDPNTLPDGRPIPWVAGGEIPSLRVDTKFFNSSYYFSKTLFGVYLPFNFNSQGLSAGYKFTINDKLKGALIVVPSDPGKTNTGLLLFIYKNTMKNVDQILQESLRNPGVLY